MYITLDAGRLIEVTTRLTPDTIGTVYSKGMLSKIEWLIQMEVGNEIKFIVERRDMTSGIGENLSTNKNRLCHSTFYFAGKTISN